MRSDLVNAVGSAGKPDLTSVKYCRRATKALAFGSVLGLPAIFYGQAFPWDILSILLLAFAVFAYVASTVFLIGDLAVRGFLSRKVALAVVNAIGMTVAFLLCRTLSGLPFLVTA